MNDVDRILLVTVNKHETNAVLAAFKVLTGAKPALLNIEDRVYRDLGNLNGTRLFHALSEMGSGAVGAAQQSVDKAIRALSPTMVIAVGIAFGVNEKKQCIGDILVSRQLMLYESQRVGTDLISPRGDKIHASARLVNLFEGVAQSSWQGNEVHFGVLLSGEKLVDNVDYRSSLLKLESEAVGGEMEGAGVYTSSHDHKIDWIIVKAICDWADGQKGKNKKARQEKAAASAAAFVAHALSQVFHGRQQALPGWPSTSQGAVEEMSMSHLDRVGPWLEELTQSIQTYHQMMSNYIGYILNKVPHIKSSFETQRFELDVKVLELVGKLQIYVPTEFRCIIFRIRKILSCSWQDPLEIYYLLLHTGGKFPRAPLEAALTMVNDLIGCYIDMAFEFMRGMHSSAPYLALLHKHRLNTDGLPAESTVLIEVARAIILEHEYFDSSDRSHALNAYKALTEPNET